MIVDGEGTKLIKTACTGVQSEQLGTTARSTRIQMVQKHATVTIHVSVSGTAWKLNLN